MAVSIEGAVVYAQRCCPLASRQGGGVVRVLVRLSAWVVVLALTFGIAVEAVGAVSTKTVDVASPIPEQQITYTIAIDEASDQHNGRPIYSVSITDDIVAPYTFVSATCSLSCTITTPAVGASGTVTITGFGAIEGPHDPTLTGTVTIVVAAPNAVGESFTNQACLDVFVSPTMSDPQYCISAPEVTTIDAPTATPTETAAATATETATATSTSTPTATNTLTAISTSTSTVAPTETLTGTTVPTSTLVATSEPTSTSSASAVAPTATSDAELGDAATTGDDVTDLPNTGTQSKEDGSNSDVQVIALLFAALAVVAVTRLLIRGRNLTM